MYELPPRRVYLSYNASMVISSSGLCWIAFNNSNRNTDILVSWLSARICCISCFIPPRDSRHHCNKNKTAGATTAVIIAMYTCVIYFSLSDFFKNRRIDPHRPRLVQILQVWVGGTRGDNSRAGHVKHWNCDNIANRNA